MSLRETLVAKREEKLAEATAVVETAETEARDITAEELEAIKAARSEVDALDARIAELDAVATRAASAPVSTPKVGGATVTAEPSTYRKGGQNSYFRDLFAAQTRGDADARDRLVRNDREVRADLSTVDGEGGEFVPPLWLVNDWIAYARAGRITADLLDVKALPKGTDSISLPKVATGSVVATQATENTGFQNTPMTTESVTSAVTTLGGIQIMSVQLLEQSPISVDEVLVKDLAADYARALDTFVLSSNATGKKGLLAAAGVTEAVSTQDIIGAGGLWSTLSNVISQIHTNRFEAPDAIVMHPRRWAALLAAADTTDRPLIVPNAYGRFNGLGAQDNTAAQGFVGSIQGLPVALDANVPTNLGAGDDEDVVIVFRRGDSILFEGTPKAEVFRETYANQGSVLVRMYNYAALATERYPYSIGTITGLTAPTF
jgi:HK97 family phage major capsid protein